MSNRARNILIAVATVILVAVALTAYFFLPLNGLQYPAGKYSSGTEDEYNTTVPEKDETSDKGEHTVDDFEYDLKYITMTVDPGDVATVRAQGKPDTKYSIEVWYSSGLSSARGLEDKVSDAEGNVEWSWTVNGNVNPGFCPIYIKENGETVIRTWIQVME